MSFKKGDKQWFCMYCLHILLYLGVDTDAMYAQHIASKVDYSLHRSMYLAST